MSTPDLLAEFFAATPRQSPNLGGRSGVHAQVDQALNELQVPATVDKDGDWKLQTDVGPFLLIVDKESQDLVLVQTLEQMERKVKNSADSMYVLLALNFEARGIARFGALKDGDQNLLVVTARLGADELGRDSVERMLRDSFRLSRRVDELMGREPAQAQAGQPGDWQSADAALAQAEQAREGGDGQPAPAAPAPPAPTDAPPQGPPQTPAPQGPPQTPAQAAPEPAAEPVQPAPEPAPTRIAAQPAERPPEEKPEPPQPPQPAPQPPTQQLPPANWYPDPYRQARLRYWDGRAWTQHTAQ